MNIKSVKPYLWKNCPSCKCDRYPPKSNSTKCIILSAIKQAKLYLPITITDKVSLCICYLFFQLTNKNHSQKRNFDNKRCKREEVLLFDDLDYGKDIVLIWWRHLNICSSGRFLHRSIPFYRV